jgi:hypothetical protein
MEYSRDSQRKFLGKYDFQALISEYTNLTHFPVLRKGSGFMKSLCHLCHSNLNKQTDLHETCDEHYAIGDS